jgi:hypothetical protein
MSAFKRFLATELRTQLTDFSLVIVTATCGIKHLIIRDHGFWEIPVPIF